MQTLETKECDTEFSSNTGLQALPCLNPWMIIKFCCVCTFLIQEIPNGTYQLKDLCLIFFSFLHVYLSQT